MALLDLYQQRRLRGSQRGLRSPEDGRFTALDIALHERWRPPARENVIEPGRGDGERLLLDVRVRRLQAGQSGDAPAANHRHMEHSVARRV
jgi:hypothetical protein